MGVGGLVHAEGEEGVVRGPRLHEGVAALPARGVADAQGAEVALRLQVQLCNGLQPGVPGEVLAAQDAAGGARRWNVRNASVVR